MERIREILEGISPVLIKPGSDSVTIGVSKRFFLFKLMNRIINLIEEDPHLNFVAFLKSYKVLGKILSGTLHEMYRDRNRIYFKNFFYDRSLYEVVKKDIEYLYPEHGNLKMTITKRGVIIYDNFKKGGFNTLLLTIHSGIWVPERVQDKFMISDIERQQEEDRDTHRIYNKLVLEKGGIWIDNKQSRFVIDFNRSIEGAVYDSYKVDDKVQSIVWKQVLSKRDYTDAFQSYREFYFTLSKLLDAYDFNIIFDGHSMKQLPGRPNISFGTRYIPNFYMPIVKTMQRKMIAMGYKPVMLNNPYGGGFILKWLSTKFPNIFIFSMEVNKCLYMTKDRMRSIERKLQKLSTDVSKIFDLDTPEENKMKWPDKKKRTSAADYI